MSLSSILYAGYLVQAAGALLTAALYYAFYRLYGRDYLLEWTRSWLALSVYLIYSAVIVVAHLAWPSVHPVMATASAVASLGGWLQVAWLLLGTYELSAGRRFPTDLRRRLFILLVPVAIATGMIFSWDSDSAHRHYMLSVGVRAGASGVAFFITAYAIWRTYRKRSRLGQRIVLGALLAYGLQETHQFVLAVIGVARGARVSYAPYLGFGDFAVQFVLGIGLVVWLLENERRAADDAMAAVEHLAYHDALTGLPNRQLFLDRLAVAVANGHREGHRLAVLFVDLDRFKTINDSLGHAAGDALLRVVAWRMQAALRENDTVARLGGDEFTILTPHIERGEDALTIAHKVREAVEQPMTIEERELLVTASLGISLYPDDGETAETLLRNADSALYRAKARGRDAVELYRPAMNSRALEQLALESSMRRALANGEFVVFYQPVIDAGTGRVTGMEALLRWAHPELGLLLPADFIFLAEVTGLVVPVGEWAMRTACAQTRAWQLAGHSGLRVAVNLSVRQLQERDFVERVERVLSDTGLAAESLDLEITESIAMHGAEHGGDPTIDKLRALRRRGVRIAIDDFGTGYSSLSVLRMVPVDVLKIDRSFVHDVATRGDGDGSAITAAVIALAHSLDLIVVAEGVETEAQLRFLRSHQCDAWQGYLAGRPASAAATTELLARHLALHEPPERGGADRP